MVKQEINEALRPINQKLDSHTKVLDSHGAKLDNHTASLMSIEHTLEGYSDMYKINKEDNEKLNHRVKRIENQLVIPHLD